MQTKELYKKIDDINSRKRRMLSSCLCALLTLAVWCLLRYLNGIDRQAQAFLVGLLVLAAAGTVIIGLAFDKKHELFRDFDADNKEVNARARTVYKIMAKHIVKFLKNVPPQEWSEEERFAIDTLPAVIISMLSCKELAKMFIDSPFNDEEEFWTKVLYDLELCSEKGFFGDEMKREPLGPEKWYELHQHVIDNSDMYMEKVLDIYKNLGKD